MSNNEIMVNEDLLPVEVYRNGKNMRDKSVSFRGSPSKHPYEDDKFILILDPISDHTEYFEFRKMDIVFVEDMPSILTKNDETVCMKTVWIKEGAPALKLLPFIVAKTKNNVALF